MSRYDIDILLIGQGLAGSLLAWQLVHRGQRILVLDDQHATAASTVAAGLINPVTGQRLVKTEGVDDYLPAARQTYQSLETILGRKLLWEKPLWRLTRTEQERQQWDKRKQDREYQAYLGEWLEAESLNDSFIAPLGGFVQQQTGYLDTNALLGGLREYMQETGRYRSQVIDYQDIQLEKDAVVFAGIRCERVIFCEGYRAIHNPWFNWLPFAPVKGEILSLQIERPLPDVIISAGHWLMPRGQGEYRLGATYDREHLDEVVTDEARQVLLQAMSQLVKSPLDYQVLAQGAGVRPATQDRQPLIGLHPRLSRLAIFNGFGSKGSLLIPWHAERFAEVLLDGVPLPETADIKRHLQRYSGGTEH